MSVSLVLTIAMIVQILQHALIYTVGSLMCSCSPGFTGDGVILWCVSVISKWKTIIIMCGKRHHKERLLQILMRVSLELTAALIIGNDNDHGYLPICSIVFRLCKDRGV